MKVKLQETNDLDTNLDNKNLDGLLALYRWTLPQLQECASYEPSQNLDLDIEEMELNLLSLQERIVRAAAKQQVDTDSDLRSLMELWYLVWSSEDNGPQLSDDLVLTLHGRFVNS